MSAQRVPLGRSTIYDWSTSKKLLDTAPPDYGALYSDRLSYLKPHCIKAFQQRFGDNIPFSDDILTLTAAASAVAIQMAPPGSPVPPGSPSPASPRATARRALTAGQRASADVSPALAAALETGADVWFVGLAFHERPPLEEAAAAYGKLLGFSIPALSKPAGSLGNLVFEDHSGRVAVTRIAETARRGVAHTAVPDGAVLAVRGFFENGANFVLTDLIVPAPAFLRAPGTLLKSASGPRTPEGADVNVLVISDLSLGGDVDKAASLTALTEWLAGRLPLPTLPDPASVGHVVVIGDSIVAPESTAAGAAALLPEATVNALTTYAALASPVEEADRALALLAAACPTTVVPGMNDPTDLALPQRPLPAVVLPRSVAVSTLTHAPCPAVTGFGGVGTHMQDARVAADIAARVDLAAACAVAGAASYEAPAAEAAEAADEDEDATHALFARQVADPAAAAAALELCLRLRHLAPTAPSSVDMAAAVGDPFVLRAAPALWVSGGHAGMAARHVMVPVSSTFDREDSVLAPEAVRSPAAAADAGEVADAAAGRDHVRALLLAAPSFSRTNSAVLVSMRTLEPTLLRFGAPAEAGVEAVEAADEDVEFEINENSDE